MEKLNLTEISYASDDELLAYLKKQWDFSLENHLFAISYSKYIDNLKLPNGNNIYLLKKIFHPISKNELEYPIANLDPRCQINTEGIFIPKAVLKNILDPTENTWPNLGTEKIKFSLKFAEKSRREHPDRPNPLKLIVSGMELLDMFPKEALVIDSTGNTLVERSLFNYFETKNKAAIAQQLEHLQKDTHIEIDTLAQLKTQTSSEQNKLNELESILAKQRELRNELEDEIKAMSKTHEDLLATVKNNAARFQDLGLLSEDDLGKLFPENRKKEPGEHLSFSEHLKSDPGQLIRHVQAYLYKTGILYPRHILADFFALLQTGDLIILAGDSGSGKTQLVKSFADAIGGRHAIIPVKPNWTGSEDLLGYYNPLEKRFLPSAFTEALLEAREHPEEPYLICLDEMNLARVEYYFADFLSKLEERNPEKEPIIHLYPEEEADSSWVELNGALKLIDDMVSKHGAGKISFIEMMQDEKLNKELRTLFGLSDKESLMGYYIHLRSIVRNSIMNTPSKYKFPANVRIIGAINMDETTNFLSPKILDRAHIIKFDNPLSYPSAHIKDEIAASGIDDDLSHMPVKLAVIDLGSRTKYPVFDEDDEFCSHILPLIKNYLRPLGVEFGFRAIRQGLNYRDVMLRNKESFQITLNNFILHKILPKLSFDGSRKISGTKEKLDTLREMASAVKELLGDLPSGVFHAPSYHAAQSLEDMIVKAEANDKNVNYWS